MKWIKVHKQKYHEGFISIDQYNAYMKSLNEFFESKELLNIKSL